ncbi:Tubulin specific chaperone E [Spironucleus salmonicida]|uniref:Tubulin specific chaperone E n=1 Tax=Spironucleus salmonicida TaxID=348837 RepID=V6LKU5_9EUKA|nr:Tubulin specific chaperone E [Spironucleus salmonicida]|eukprot:EST45172.1 Tubulin specific chaperone E [Spironucleus salmonicida]
MFVINERVMNSETREKATIVFIGDIKDQQFIGISYDNAVGKYDGMFENIRYFTSQPLHGAFVKPKKLLKCLETLIVEKYVTSRQATSEMQFSDGMLDKAVEFKGISQIDKQQSQIGKLQSISVENCGFIDDFEKLNALIPNCEFLDLSGNPINGEALLLLKFIKSLKILDLGGVNFDISEDITSQLSQINFKTCSIFINEIQQNQINVVNNLLTISCITEILMNNVNIDLNMLTASNSIVKLQLNHAQKMTFSQFLTLIQKFPNLSHLSLVNNLIYDEEINKKSINNQLNQINFIMQDLIFLNIAKCKISLQSLYILNQLFPNLKHFRISDIDNFGAEKVANFACAVFFKTIKTFNAGDVTRKQIQDFRIFYANFMLKKQGFMLRNDLICQQIVIEFQIQVSRTCLEGCEIELLQTLKNCIYDEKTDQGVENSESGIVKKKYNGRIIQVKYGNTSFLVSRVMPIWQFREILEKKDVKGRWIVVDNCRELIERIPKYQSLDAIVSESICEVI